MVDLIGREKELELLRNHLQSAIDGKGSTVFISGESGIGKTVLIEKILTQAQSTGITVVTAKAQREQAEPYFIFTKLFHELRHIKETKVFSMVLLPVVQETLIPISSEELRSVRAHTYEKVTEYVTSMARKRTLVIFFDDLHFADRASLGLLHYLARNIRNSRVLIICTYRTEDLDDRHPLKETLFRMKSEDLYTAFELNKLNPDETKKLLSMHLSGPVPDELVDTIFQKTAGHPLFAIEMLNMLHAESRVKVFSNKMKVNLQKIKVPGMVCDLVNIRIQDLSDFTRQCLAQAAVIGEEFEFGVLTHAMSVNEEKVLDALDIDLAGIKLISEDLAKDGYYKFNHPLFRDAIYKKISEEEKRSLHLKAGYAFEQCYSKKLDTVLYPLAIHFWLGKDLVKASGYLRKAAENAEKEFANEDAILFYSRLLNLIPDSPERKPERSQIREKIADLHVAIGDYDTAVGYYVDAIGPEPQNIAIVNRKIGEVYEKISRYDQSMKYYDVALVAARKIQKENDDSHEPIEVAKIYNAMGWVYNRKGEWDQAIEYCEKALKLAEYFGDKREMASSFHILGTTYASMSDYLNATEFLDKSRKIFEDVHDLHKLSAIYVNIGVVHSKRDSDRALEYFSKALKISEKVGDPMTRSVIMNNIGIIHFEKGNLDKAIEMIQRSLDISEQIGDQDGIGTSLLNIGSILSEKGELGKAQIYLERSVNLFEKLGDQEGMALSLCNLGDTLFRNNHVKKSESLAKQALDISLKIESKEGEGLARKLIALVKASLNDFDGSVFEFEKAVSLLQDSGDLNELTQTLLDYGRVLKRNKEATRASETLGKALKLAQEGHMERREKEIRKEMD